MGQSYFESLPLDLILEITCHLYEWDLRRLCLTSKFCRLVAEPQLYSEYHQPYRGSSIGFPRWQSVLPFLRTIVQRELAGAPQPLGGFCKSVSISGWSSPYEEYMPDRIPLTLEEQADFKQAAVKRGIISEGALSEESEAPASSIIEKKFAMRFGKEINSSIPDALVILMLSSLPNLRELRIRDRTTTLARLRWDWPCKKGMLQNLRVLHINGEAMAGPSYNLNAFKVVLTLPTLRTLLATDCEAAKLSLDPDSSHLEEVSLKNAELGPAAVRSLINACKRLRRLLIKPYDDHANHDFEATPHTLRDITEPLRKHRHWLEFLNCEMYQSALLSRKWIDPNAFCYGTTLADFTCLRTLSGNFETLTGWPGFTMRQINRFARRTVLVDVLPSSIEKLVIQACWPDIVNQLRQIAVHQKIKFPKLKKVYILAWKAISGSTQRSVKAMYRHLGIKLQMFNCRLTSYLTFDEEEVLTSDEDSLEDIPSDPGSPETPAPIPPSHTFRNARGLNWLDRNAEESSGPEQSEEYPTSGPEDQEFDTDSDEMAARVDFDYPSTDDFDNSSMSQFTNDSASPGSDVREDESSASLHDAAMGSESALSVSSE